MWLPQSPLLGGAREGEGAELTFVCRESVVEVAVVAERGEGVEEVTVVAERGVVIAEYMPNPNQISPPPLSLLSVEMGLHSGHSRGTTIPRYVNI